MPWRAPGKHFYHLRAQEEVHVLTLSTHLVEPGSEAHWTHAPGVQPAEGSLYIILYETFHHPSFLDVEHMRFSCTFFFFFFFLQKACCTGYSGLVWRKIWHFVLSICPVSVVLGPVQVFAFCSSGDRCYNHYKAVVKCPAEHVRVSNGERQKVLCLFSPRSREDSSTLAEHAEAVQTRMGRLSAERWALHFIHTTYCTVTNYAK